MPHDWETSVNSPLLSSLDDGDARALAAAGGIRRYPTGAYIAREGEPGDALHTVLEGSVRIVLTDPGGAETTLTVLGPGDTFGELSLLDGRPRSASAIAAEPTRTLVVTRNDFDRWLADRPAAARGLLTALSLRLRQTDNILADFTFCPLPQRLARRLLALADAQRGPHLAITQAALASMLGVSREHVNKELNAFARQGRLALARGAVHLRDIPSLERIASGVE